MAAPPRRIPTPRSSNNAASSQREGRGEIGRENSKDAGRSGKSDAPRSAALDPAANATPGSHAHLFTNLRPPRSIVTFPDPVLRKKTIAITTIDEHIHELVADMKRVMAELGGGGLAAPQVSVPLRLFITAGKPNFPDLVFINPVIEIAGAVEAHDEGCLSLPDIVVAVLRPTAARITATALDGSLFTLETSEFAARVWQHEFDHLEGRLIIDRMTPRDKLTNRKALRDLERAYEERRGG
ncbi:MAG: peptide deformylase [Phycisphaerales bacterium]|nr:peptide deformylase [Phycisphaerales bacterium]